MRGLRERQEWQFFAHLPRAGRPLAFAWWALVVLRSVLPPVFAITTGAVIGAVVASGGGSTDRAARRDGRGLRGAPGVRPAPPDRQREPRQPDVGLALRRPHRLVQHAARHRAPRGPHARGGHHRRPRVRQRPPRAADGGQPAVHRRRADRPRHRRRLGRRPGRLHLVGAAGARAAPGAPPTGCCARARSGRTATPTRCARPACTPSTPSGSPSIRRRPRSCGSSGCPTGSSTGSPSGAGSCFDLQQAATRLRERSLVISVLLVSVANVGVLVALAARPLRGVGLPRPGGRLRPGRRRHVADRLRRPQLGPRRGGGTGRRRAPAPREHRAGRCAVPGRARRGRRAAHLGDPLPRRLVRLPAHRARGAPRPRPDDPGGVVAGHRRPERRRQDHARQAVVPALRPDGGCHRGRRRPTCATSRSPSGAAGSPRCSRTSPGSSCRCATTWRRTARPTRTCSPPSSPPGPTTSRRSTRSSRRSTPAGSTSPEASGSAWRSHEPCAPYAAGPGWCSSTSPPPSSTSAGRRRSSAGCSRRPEE